MKRLRGHRLPAAVAAAALLVFLAFSEAAAQAPTPVEVPASVRAAERQQLASRRVQLMNEREALRTEAARHNQACSSVTEGTEADAACIAAQQRLTARIGAFRDDVAQFNAAVANAPRASVSGGETPRQPARRPSPARAASPTTAASTPAQAPTLDPGVDVYFASVTGVGDFSVVMPDGDRLSAEQVRGRPLPAGTRVITGANARGEITLPDGTRFSLGPGTQLTLTLDGSPPRSIYDVVSGTLRAVSARLRQGALAPRWNVRTPHAIAGVRGTDFQVTVEPGGGGSWRVNDGAIELRTPEGRVLALLSAGQRLVWDDSLRIVSLGTEPARVAAGNSRGRMRTATAHLVAWGRENGLLAAVVLLLGLVLIQLFTTRRRTG